MAIIGTFTQQPADELDYDVDYAAFLIAGDAIDTVITPPAATVSPAGLTVGSPLVSGTRVKLWVSGGQHSTTYKVTLTTRTTGGRIKQDELRFKIKEI